MSIGEPARYHLYEAARAGRWADVATKQDLDALETSLRGEIAVLRGELHHEFGLVRTEMAHRTRTFVLSVAGLMVAGAGVALTTAQLVS